MYMGHGTRGEEGGGVRPREEKEEPKSKKGGLSPRGRNRRQRSRRTSVCSGAQGIRQNVVPLRKMCSSRTLDSSSVSGRVRLRPTSAHRASALRKALPFSAAGGLHLQARRISWPTSANDHAVVIHSLMPSTVADVWRIVARNRSCEKLRKRLN